jgi:hypothetical protein
MAPELCRAARGVLGWSQGDLAKHARLNRVTIAGYEGGSDQMTLGNRLLIQLVFKEAGVEFTGGDDELPGVRVIKPELIKKYPQD